MKNPDIEKEEPEYPWVDLDKEIRDKKKEEPDLNPFPSIFPVKKDPGPFDIN